MLARLRILCAGIRFRLFMLVGVIGVAMFAALLVIGTLSELSRVREERVADALSVTAVMARALEGSGQHLDAPSVEKALAAVRARSDVLRVALTDRELSFMLDGKTKILAPIPVSKRSDVQMRSLKTGQTEHEVRDGVIEVAEPLMAAGHVIGSVAATFRGPGLAEILSSVLGSTVAIVIPIIGAGLLFAFVLAIQVAGPLGRMRETVDKFSDGDLDQRIRIEGFRELRLLGEAFGRLTERLKSNIEQIYELAYVDRITRLPNREYFRNELTRAIKQAERRGTAGAVLFIDLDGFKQVNDTLGHEVGDRLLRAFAKRVSKVIRANDTLTWQAATGPAKSRPEGDKHVMARLGGDEFTILLAETREETDAAGVARRIIAATGEIFFVDDAEVKLGASIGIATFPRDGSDCQSVIRSADMAMYQAKEDGKNTYRFFSEELNHHAARRLEIESDLRRALDRAELELYFQPKVDCATGRPASAEAFIRWNHPVQGLLDPSEFIRIAEKTGLILPLGNWVLQSACEHIHELLQAGFDLPVAVNISSYQFEQPDFAQRVLGIVETCAVRPQCLELDITENMAMTNPRRTLEHVRRLKRAGIRIAVDDFGTGRTNLSQLSRLRVDVIKIDRSFIDLLQDETDESGRRTVNAILALTRSLGCETVAEGVETEEQRRYLADAGCSHAQGYLFGRPMPINEFLQWLSLHKQEKAEAQADKQAAPAA